MIHADVLGERARLTPDREALVELATGRRFTYGELDGRANRLARVWTDQLGLRRGDRVAILCGNRVELVDSVFAAAKTGVVLVPLNTRLAAPELAQILHDCEPAALLFDPAFGMVMDLREIAELDHWIALDSAGDVASGVLPEIARGVSEQPVGGPPCAPEDLLCLLYTSGTTGRPKGVMIPHRMFAWNGFNTVCSWQLRETDRSPIFTPLYHAGGLGAFLVPIFTVGGAIVLHAGFDREEVWETIERERCTVALGVPTIWRLLLESPALEGADLRHVRWLISGGAPLPESLVEQYRELGVILRQGYGLTEVGVNCFAMSDEDAWSKVGSIGRPLMFTEARIVDEAGAELPANEVGELVFRGPHVSSGYWRDPEATSAAYDADGWFHTGDLARRDEDGFFYIAGRRKEMFISGGVNVYPAEIEAVLLEHADVADAAVVGVPDEQWGEVGVAWIVPRPDRNPAPDDLARFLEARVARYKVPKAWQTVDELPRTEYGKVRRSDLVERYTRRKP